MKCSSAGLQSLCRPSAPPPAHQQRRVAACQHQPRRQPQRQASASRRAAACAASAADASAAAAAGLRLQPQQPVIKVCGVTNPEDAAAAAEAGAHLVGMILWPRAKRSIPPAVARRVAAAARAGGAEPVGVFVDEDAATIARVCDECDVRVAQLHGDGARAALGGLPPQLAAVWVVHADPSGARRRALPPPPADVGGRRAAWLIVDSLQGGSGEAFDWRRLRSEAAPALAAHATHGWLLAGGLTPDSVAEAIATAAPTGVDVSSGVCGPDGLRKDGGKLRRYCSEAAAAFGLGGCGGPAR